jgi:uncharacterized protein YecE (DUF72 family)
VTFYRSPRKTTLERWRDTVPPGFKFAVKAPRAITHAARLDGARGLLDRFLADVAALGDALGPLLFQLPPSLACDATRLSFFEALRHCHDGLVTCEPRHASWFTPQIDAVLRNLRIARVAADPAPAPGAGQPGGWTGLAYFRLHGSPRVYYSAYPDDALHALAARIAGLSSQGEVWCIFDNTASGAALPNALDLLARLSAVPAARP